MTEAPAALNIKSAYAEAMALMQAGKGAAALEVFGAIHEANPHIPEVEYQIARLFSAHDRFDRAAAHAAAAAALAPAQFAIWTTWAEIAALDGSADARKAFLAAIKAAPLTAAQKAALSDRFGPLAAQSRPATGGASPQVLAALLADVKEGRMDAADKAAARLLSTHPGCALAANVRGSTLAAKSQPDDAIRFFRAAIAADPGYAEAYANMAPVLARLGRTEEAKTAYRNAIARAPDHVPALTGLGQLMLTLGHAKPALHWLDRAAVLAPNRADVQKARGNACTVLRDYAGAQTAFAAAARIAKRKEALPLMLLAQAEAHLGNDDAAEAAFKEALALEPGQPEILGALGVFLQGLGRFDEAEAIFLRAIAASPNSGEPYRLFYASHKAQPGEPMLAEMERRFASPGLADRDRMAFGFAIAKALEDIKDNARVFDYLDPANALMRKTHPYDSADREDQIARLIEALDGVDWQGVQVPDPSDAAPIFVTGMPRSGTTLIEQILASHSRVTGAGELADGSVSAARLLVGGKNGGFRAAHSIPGSDFARLGHDYAAMIKARFPDADRITDKSIQTYLYLGLTKLALPNARFIVVRRDPRDTLLSIYKNVFPEGTHLYAYDQVDLARQYSTFVRMIDFWRARVPGWFHEVEYEALVSDPEPQSRALIQAAGLEWEDACLNFHQNSRKVETLSVFQVRQPISKGSVRAWERYADRLKPMIDQLSRDGHIKD